MFHTDSPLRWRPDGFRYLVSPSPQGDVPMRMLVGSYLLCLPAVLFALLDPVFTPLLLSFLLPLPLALFSASISPPPTAVDVDHRRVLIEQPLGRRRTIPLRAIQGVRVLEGGLEFLLHAGERLKVKTPAEMSTLWWLAERITELRDEVSRFEDELGERRPELVRVLAVSPAREQR